MRLHRFHPTLSDIAEIPIRGEIFGIERLEEYATYLAENLKTDKKVSVRRQMLRRNRDNGDRLLACHQVLVQAAQDREALSPAAEWLLDNFHIVEEQLREIQEDLPNSYYRELPKLSVGELSGFPRVYALALALVAHTDSRLEVETLRKFVESFQQVSYLNLGELWALPIVLRLVLVENLRRVSSRVVWDRNQRLQADQVISNILACIHRPDKLCKSIECLADYCGHNIENEYAFIAQMATSLRDQEADVWPVLERLEKLMADQKISVEEVVSLEHQHQARNQVTIANIIMSMRLLSNINWKTFFQSVSLLDRDLLLDPTNEYGGMDFSTQDQYRHAIERIGKRSGHSERDIAAKALALAHEEKMHVGHFLIGKKNIRLEKEFNYRPPIMERLLRGIKAWPTFFYISVLLLLTLTLLAISLSYAFQFQPSLWQISLVTILVAIPCSDLAVSFFNFFLTHLLKPKSLPKMDLSEGIPLKARTLITIPCIFSDPETVKALLEKLEVHYLGNDDEHICFALLSDFKDSESETEPQDQPLLRQAVSGIENLNHRYMSGKEGRFFLLHRRRIWNKNERKWMGWERKRGKLEELNRLLRGDKRTSFTAVSANEKSLQGFKFVITLDADTRMGLDTAKKMVGAAIHPLNTPVVDESKQRVVQGYGIIQPRISISLESSSKSTFAAIFSGHTGIDPYTTATSDVYQDLFGEGSFTGKGLYDIDIFKKVIEGRVPENTILSHDLFEGLYARAALATDIELIDDYPTSYHSYIQRQHRWIRGDWQIARWIAPLVPDSNGKLVLNTLPLISRWKIYDNLRRSMVSVSLLLLYICSWHFLPGESIYWTLLATLIISFPCFLHVANGLLADPGKLPWIRSLWSEIGTVWLSVGQFLLTLIFLPHKAYVECDAILRALYRVHISKEACLEWVPSAQIDKDSKKAKALWVKPWPIEVFLFALLAATLLLTDMRTIFLALPFFVLWMLFPLFDAWTARRIRRKVPALAEKDRVFLFEAARRIWNYFETFVGEEDNWLPPDNVQEDPEVVIAHRTSPTNIGLYALTVLSGRDLGFCSLTEVIDRTEQMFSSIKKMEKYRGHLLNWYDTENLEPLLPKYVSLVDSGNFAGYLLAVKQSFQELARSPLFSQTTLVSSLATLQIIEREVEQIELQNHFGHSFRRTHIYTYLQEARKIVLGSSPKTVSDWGRTIRFLSQNIADILDCLVTLELEHGAKHFTKLRRWVKSQFNLIYSIEKEAQIFFPWLMIPLNEVEGVLRAYPDLADKGAELLVLLEENRSLLAWKETYREIEKIAVEICTGLSEAEQIIFTELATQCQHGLENITRFLARIESIQFDCEYIFENMDFNFLLDQEREVFCIGYNVSELRADNGYYDLLASEARLASFVAIIKGDVEAKHWFRLGRQLVPVNGGRALVSWSASMFEYLMPQLVMKNFEHSLLDETLEAIVRRQIAYGKKLDVPWGISESGYNARDLNYNYQYGPFGIPGLGLKRGLGHDLVISPYSSFLAALVRPFESVKNLRLLEEQSLMTCFGFYEAIDYTPERQEPGKKFSIIRSYMAHHQGMSLVAIDNVLNRNIMQERFHSEPRVLAAQLLLQEKVPQKVQLTEPKAARIEWENAGQTLEKSFSRVYKDAEHESPRVQILSNGKYSLVLSTAGAGYSKFENLEVIRWREDATRDNWGSFIFIRDLRTGESWSSTYQPCLKKPDQYKVTFAEDKVEFLRQDGEFSSYTQVIVAPEDDLELRYLSLRNESENDRLVEFTSYLEPVLAPHREDAAHPAFANLFLQTEYLKSRQTLLVKRRPRSSQQTEVWASHSVICDLDVEGEIEYETDRMRFIGRGRSLLNPIALEEQSILSGTVGSTLDPILSLRVKVKIPARKVCRLLFSTGVSYAREKILQMADSYHDINIFDRERRLAWTKSRIDLRHLGLDAEGAYLFQRLAERVLYSAPSLRRPSHVLAEHIRDQASLWPYGISGDLPIVVLVVDDERDMSLLHKLLRGHEYLRFKGLIYDFVILNTSRSLYMQDLHEEILRQIRGSGCQALLNKNGGIFPLRVDLIPEKDRNLIQAMARVVLSSDAGTLKEQLVRKSLPINYGSKLYPKHEVRNYVSESLELPNLKFFNGLGGFSLDGQEYVIILKNGQWTPTPWINVIANKNDFGFQVSEAGSGFTWSLNSRENRLTAWSNDPVSDPAGEIFYLRDEDTGEKWSPTPLPLRDKNEYLIRHGQGYSTFEHIAAGIYSRLTMFVPVNDSVKINRLFIKNQTSVTRRISVWAYIEWVLGNQREQSSLYILTEAVKETLFAKNPYNQEFSQRVSFFKKLGPVKSYTCDRKEFLGRNGSFDSPQALNKKDLSGRTGMGLDPCAVLQDSVELMPGSEHEFIFLLGQSESKQEVESILERYSDRDAVEASFVEAKSMWNEVLDTVQVNTPDEALNIMMNRWLLYQTIVCRFWARSAFYQSGGAYGFRDQLQDCMSFAHLRPDLVRSHILLAASRQFVEGDVQHWWHPPTGRGVRTHFSDDLLWLPLVVCHYIRVSGDTQILQEQVHFLEAPLLGPEQEDSYMQPEVSEEKASLLEHCFRSVEHSLKFGSHGLPLIGSGDWNDGMNRVGEKGKGESVWMAWFLHKVIEEILPYCDEQRRVRYESVLRDLKKNVEENGWDGNWYRRAYFDDGTPIGSRESEECKIDSLSQSWSVLSGVGDLKRQRRAMQSVSEQLILRDKKLVLLLSPPFDKTPLDPGYIKGYVPGVRENGGQYTHAALWVMMAFAKLGDNERVAEIYDMLNPIKHSKTRSGSYKYKIEPYVVAADVYAVEPHIGRGGWSWYTGSASWFYRACLESLLGIQVQGDRLLIEPCVPPDWSSYEVRYKFKSSLYVLRFQIVNPGKGKVRIQTDGEAKIKDKRIEVKLIDDQQEHRIVFHLSYEGLPEERDNSIFL